MDKESRLLTSKSAKEALDKYVGLPPGGAPEWIDWDLAVEEILSLHAKSVKVVAERLTEMFCRVYPNMGWVDGEIGNYLKALKRGIDGR